MLFFKKILPVPAVEPDLGPEPAAPAPPVERRGRQRFKVHPGSQLKAVLSFIGRDDTGAPMSSSRAGWHWRGRLLDCSELGVRLQLGPLVKAAAGDEAELLLELDDAQLRIPCHIANISEHPAGMVLGLRHDIADPETAGAFHQLLEIVALGSTLRRRIKRNRPDESGYLTEQYASDRPARLTIWRSVEDKVPAAFEFLLKDSLVRGGTGHDLQYLAGIDATTAPAAPLDKAREIHRLFRWVVPNLSASVPADVRKFLRPFAA
jgi:hypothetical protein